jgi:hypothetical protein
MEALLVNKVAQSGLITIDLEKYYPTCQIIEFDLKKYLFHGLILKEKEFRIAIKEHDWSQYGGATVLVYCSADAIIPMWSYMLVVSSLHGIAADVFCGTKTEYLKDYYRKFFKNMDISPYKNGKIILKGCGTKNIPEAAYLEATNKLREVASSIMFGEPCSTVPVYKRK